MTHTTNHKAEQGTAVREEAEKTYRSPRYCARAIGDGDGLGSGVADIRVVKDGRLGADGCEGVNHILFSGGEGWAAC